jgi:hypothetical protein
MRSYNIPSFSILAGVLKLRLNEIPEAGESSNRKRPYNTERHGKR